MAPRRIGRIGAVVWALLELASILGSVVRLPARE